MHKYKVGDKIEILEAPTDSHTMDWWKVGDIYELTSVSTERFSCKKPTGDTNGWCWDKVKFQLVSKDKEINNYPIY